MAPKTKKNKNGGPGKHSKSKNSSRKGGELFQYSENAMMQAITDVKNGLSTSKAAIKNKVPRITLLNKINKKSPVSRRMGPPTILSEEDEAMIVNWLLQCKIMNFPVSQKLLLDSVQKYLQKKRVSTPFIDNRPGRKWLDRFRARHPEINLRKPSTLTETSATVTEDDIKSWANRTHSHLRENGYDLILNEPERVYSCDEAAIFLNPTGDRVFSKKGDKTVYQRVNSDNKECLTVLVTVNAAGNQAPPLVLFKYKRIPDQIAFSVPREWGLGKSSESGGITAPIFYEFIANVFDPWLTKNKIVRPVILFVDGQSSQLSLHTSLFCSENGIVLVTLYPNSSYLTQPVDVSVFKSLEAKWKPAVQQWRWKNQHNPTLRKIHFCPLLEEVLNEIPSSAIVSGFSTCGLVPWDPSVVTNRMRQLKTLQKPKGTVYDKFNVQSHWTALKVIEHTMGPEKVELFKKLECKGDLQDCRTEDKALYRVWKDIKAVVFPPDLYHRPEVDISPDDTSVSKEVELHVFD